MKKILFFLGLAVSGAAQAQITYTNTDLPSAGTSYEFYIHQDTVNRVTSGPSGANRVWNYSTLRKDDSTETSYETAAGQPGASKFPASSLYSDGTFYVKNASGLSVDGAIFGTDTNNAFDLNPNLLILATPTTYNSTSNGFGRVVFTFQNTDSATQQQFDSIRYVVRIETTSLTDGYGTLRLPGFAATFNTLRVKNRGIETDSVYGHSALLNTYLPLQGTMDTNYNFSWLAKTYGEAILSMDSTRENGIEYTTYLKNSGTTAVASVRAATAESVFPNPAAGNIHFSLNASGTLRIIDAKGATVSDMALRNGQADFDVRSLPNGTYFYLVADPANPKSGRFVVSH